MVKLNAYQLPGLISVFYVLLITSNNQAKYPEEEITFRYLHRNHSLSSQTTKTNPTRLTTLVNPFLGTANGGNVSPGASVPFGVVKLNADCKGYNPPGYNPHPKAEVIGFSPLHDSGVGISASFNIFAVMPLRCLDGFESCKPHLENRLDMRIAGQDVASPGYFSMMLNSTHSKMEGTSTRRAGIQRYTFSTNGSRYFALDSTRDGPNSFRSGSLDIDPATGRAKLGGLWASSFAPGGASYRAFACYDLTDGAKQPLEAFAIWTTGRGSSSEKIWVNRTNLSPEMGTGAGVLFSYSDSFQTINIPFGISFVSADQACKNLEEEVGQSSFDEVLSENMSLWENKLKRLEVPLDKISSELATNIYTSMYRTFLTPHNATGEGPGVFSGTPYPYFDSMYCTWDTFRTFFPWLNLHSPVESAQIAENYIDGWRKTGSIPECRANTVAGYIQGGSSGTNVLADFAVKYHEEAAALGVHMDDMYHALLSDGEDTPALKYGYIPDGVLDGESQGMDTRQSSRTIEYAFNDFGIGQVARILGHDEAAQKYAKRSLWYRNVWDPNTTSDGFSGFFQKRRADGSFFKIDPATCSPLDTNPNKQCFLDYTADSGFYESSSWEYSYYAPHDTSHLIKLHGGRDLFLKRLDHFFNKGYYNPGNEPAFQTPLGYHYIGTPSKSVSRIRSIVLKYFDSSASGVPGNDDNGAMANWLLFHLLGLYPVPSTTEYLISSPWLPYYTIHNPYLKFLRQ